MSRYSESDLRVPALCVIRDRGSADTSTIIRALEDMLQPSGADAQILAGRRDTRFSQIVRNLMGSHYSSNGMAEYTDKDEDGCFSLTEEGLVYLGTCRGTVDRVTGGQFRYTDTLELARELQESQRTRRRLLVYSEDDTVAEGAASQVQSVARQRSQKLREAAIRHYTKNGRIVCAACGFDFRQVYGELGKGYIQIHHEKPLFQYEEEGIERCLGEAVQAVKPLCANCHCMIHRRRDAPLSVEELRARIRSRS